mmetsp:Transcript_11329/g.14923  ORF Transcript_11329/g.14923 Transcript_11329/m.14923 type:complete len:325 (+) Transcript_11329:251-1225(+)|eukprot:CAMPEP_0198137182 /NCGR_PEP_ID=MMETSP1443-20131203/712_1 /TAXON_ID=186043 /ORGANISM="Entomoneis sp., Strain CCMP2396" /LENGTH=324 /DNA_ID=CAMNT_0043798531 /DNA_START=184 /DNA_END=1158 /DNA_ORIENTATION=+
MVFSCIGSFCSEFNPCQPWYEVKEHTQKQLLDIPATFAPRGLFVIVGKLICLAFMLSTQIFAWIESSHLNFYYAYFTSWALGLASLSVIVSFLNSTIVPIRQPEGKTVSSWIKFSWMSFEVALVAEAITVVIFWTLVYDGYTLEYLDVAAHGPPLFFLMMDGLYLNRIPLRWMHMWSTWVVVLAFLIWSIIHGPLVFDIGNPNEEDNDPDTNDDAIYANLSWDSDDISSTAVTSVLVLFVLQPILFGLLRSYSRYSWFQCGPCAKDRRRYLEHGAAAASNHQNNNKNEDSEAMDEEYAASVSYAAASAGGSDTGGGGGQGATVY